MPVGYRCPCKCVWEIPMCACGVGCTRKCVDKSLCALVGYGCTRVWINPCVCLWGMGAHVNVCGGNRWVSVCVCACGVRIHMRVRMVKGIFLLLPFPLFFKAGSFTEPETHSQF